MVPNRLRTASLQLRPFERDDARAVFLYWQSDPGWERFNESVPTGFSEADARAFVDTMCARSRENAPNWAILHDGAVVGVVSLTFEEGHRSAVVGYEIHGALRGRGLAVEATQKAITEAFAAYPELERIEARTDAENVPSMRVLHKLGFLMQETAGASRPIVSPAGSEAVFVLPRAAG